MDLRNSLSHLNSFDRCEERRHIIENKLGIDLEALSIDPNKLGNAEENNCEQMFGHVSIPVGLAGPLNIHFSSNETVDVYLPIATTEAALVASVNRGCKAVNLSDGVVTKSIYHGITRSLAFKDQRLVTSSDQLLQETIINLESDWKKIGESTSSHLKIINYYIDQSDNHLFLTINCNTDKAMGMNMVTIAAQKIGEWIDSHISELEFVTVAGNVDSDKKPSKRTHDLGRGYEVFATADISEKVIKDVLHTTPNLLLATAEAKLNQGSKIAKALSSNLQSANIISALYLATGQDPAHVVEGSLTDTTITSSVENPNFSLRISVRCPAILVGVCGGGTQLPAQKQCLDLLLKQVSINNQQSTINHTSIQNNKPTYNKTKDSKESMDLHICRKFAEIIGATVLSGEISLLAAQATHTLAKSHKKLAR